MWRKVVEWKFRSLKALRSPLSQPSSPDLLHQPIITYRRVTLQRSYYILRIPKFYVDYLGGAKVWQLELGNDKIILRPVKEFNFKELRGSYRIRIASPR
jgi:hypothetical protein